MSITSLFDTLRRLRAHALNELWPSYKQLPYYNEMITLQGLPMQFVSLDEFSHVVPPTVRAVVQERSSDMAFVGTMPHRWLVTGGSTAEPIRIPTWRKQSSLILANTWLGRSWYGIAPDDKLFLLWGHSHLLGNGLCGFVRAKQRQVADSILRYRRYSAYDISDASLRKAAVELLKFRPLYVLGYARALDLFARVNRARASDIRSLGLKAVIATAESFPSPNSKDVVEEVFGAPVGMEYGCVEAGVIAHSHPLGGYTVFWHPYLVEAIRSDRAPNAYRILITSLYPRCFPLVRYELGDEITFGSGAPRPRSPLAEFSEIRGRSNQYVRISSGKRIHSEVFSHVLRGVRDITAFQVVARNGRICLRLCSPRQIRDADIQVIRTRLAKVDKELRHLEIRPVDKLTQTVAGKTPMVILEHGPAQPG